MSELLTGAAIWISTHTRLIGRVLIIAVASAWVLGIIGALLWDAWAQHEARRQAREDLARAARLARIVRATERPWHPPQAPGPHPKKVA